MKTSAGQSSTSLLCLPIPVGSRANRKEPNYFWFADHPRITKRSSRSSKQPAACSVDYFGGVAVVSGVTAR